MTTYYKATAEDGSVFTRSTAERKYTHCVAIHRIPYKETKPRWCGVSWAGRPDLAQKEASRRSGPGRTIAVLSATEITAKEYRELKAAS